MHQNNNENVAELDSKEREKIEAHIRKYIGDFDLVLHPIVSETVHIDICVVKPTPERDFYTLVTCGMSALPMFNDGVDEPLFTELMLALPADWPLTPEGIMNPNNFWPVEWLQRIALLPHENNIFVGLGDTIPNGDPAEPLADNTNFSGFILGLPCLVDKEFVFYESDEKTIFFLGLFPLYEAEMDYKLAEGADAFFDRADEADLTEYVDIERAPIVEA